MVSSAEPGMKKYMNSTATLPSANAIGAPDSMSSTVATANRPPIASIDIVSWRSREGAAG